MIRDLPDETKGPFIDELVKKDQRQLIFKLSVRLAHFFESSIQLVSRVNVTYENEVE